MAQHCHNRLLLYKEFEGLGRRTCDRCQLFRIRILVQTGICEDEGSVCTVLAIRNNHQEESGYQFGSRFGLQDLQAGT